MAAKAALSEVDTALSDLHTWRRDHERRVRETRQRLESASRGLEEEDRERREAEEAVQAAEAALAEIDAELARSRDEERQRAGMQKRMMWLLHQQVQRYWLLAKMCNDVIVHATTSGLFLYLSPKCKMMLGYQPSELSEAALLRAVNFKGAIKNAVY